MRRRRRREEIREERKRKAHNFIEDLEGGGVASCSGAFGYFLH